MGGAARRDENVFGRNRLLADSNFTRAGELASASEQLDAVFLQVVRVDAAHALDVRFTPCTECAEVVPAHFDVEAVAAPRACSASTTCAAFHITFLGTQPTFTQVPPSSPVFHQRRPGPRTTAARRADANAAAAAANYEIVEAVHGLGSSGFTVPDFASPMRKPSPLPLGRW